MHYRPIRIQRERKRGWKMPENTVYVDRPTKWGNPYVGGNPFQPDPDSVSRHRMVALYCNYLEQPDQRKFIEQVKAELRGKNLACWCPLDQPCHADVLLQIANEESAE